LGVDPALLLVISGFLAFFTIEKTLHWHHHWRTGSEHTEDEEKSGHAANLILIGDGVHNFADGVIIATSFIADLSLGVITTIAIILHEIPQEMGDFGVLIHSGMGRKKAIWYNFLSAVTAVGGGVLTYFFLSISTALVNFSLPVAAGGLLYIASADLIPELHHEKNFKIGLLQIFTLIGGVVIMYYLKAFFG
jgi:zinc and cadmium transporter